MTETVRTIGRADPGPADDLDGGLAVSPGDLGERLWHFFISMRTGLALILALAVLGLIGTMLVQAPSGLGSDPKAYAAWVETLRPKYGGWTGIFDTLGLFNIFNSVWFRGITVLLMTSVLACSANRAPHLWKLTVHPRTDMSEPFFDHAPLSMRATGRIEPAAAAADIQAAFARRHFRTIVHDEGDLVHVYADHNRWGPFGTVIAHLSLVVILLGALVGTAFGFRDDGLAVAVGSTADIGRGTGLVGRSAQLQRLLLRERQPERLRQRPGRLPGRAAGRRGDRPGQPADAGGGHHPLSVLLRGRGGDEGRRRLRQGPRRGGRPAPVDVERRGAHGRHDRPAGRRDDDVRPGRRLGRGRPDHQGRPDAGRAVQDRIRRTSRSRPRSSARASRSTWPGSRSRSFANGSSRG